MRRGLSISEYGIAEVETGEVHSFANEEEVYRLPRLRVDPAGAARERRRARGGAQRRAAEARRARRPARRPAHAHDLVGRQGLARGDGRPRGREGLRVLRDLRPLAPPARRAGSSSRHAAIDALNAQVPLTLLKGIEVNIRVERRARRADDEILAGARLGRRVGAQRVRQGPDRTRAGGDGEPVRRLHRPRHRTARSASARRPTIDVERVIEKALETGTFLEINSQPDRLDLTDVHARAAREAGLKLVIDSDGHQVSALDYVELGVGQARRAWLTKDDVVNTRTLAAAASELRKRADDLPRRPRRGLATGSPSYLETVGERPVVPRGRAGRGAGARCRPRRPSAASRSRTCCATSTR